MNDLQERFALGDRARKDLCQIRELLASIQCCDSCRVTGSLDRATVVARLLEKLKALRAILQRQFAEEIEGGPVEEAACQCPTLAREVQRLVHDQPRLMHSLDAFIGKLERRDSNGCLPRTFARWCDAFSKRLCAHEDRKVQVLASGLGVSILD